VSLTTGRGPLSPDPIGRFNVAMPSGVTFVEPFPRQVTALLDGVTVVNSERVVLVHRPGRSPEYAFPAQDVAGVATQPEPELAGYVTVAWGAVDSWFEEGNPSTGHPRSPYHRIDCLRSTRWLNVEVAGVTLVDTRDTIVLYETGLNPRLYVSPNEMRGVTLEASATTTFCPYKGTAWYWNVTVGEITVNDIGWSYEDPLPESLDIKGLLSFYETRAILRHDLPSPVALTS
jgi:uncharacterized protein (DUF427 family)